MATICNHHVISCMHGLRQNNLPQQQALERAGINPAVMGPAQPAGTYRPGSEII